MKHDLPRVLVVCDNAEQRHRLGALLYELQIDVVWQLQLDGLAEFARWCQPQAVVLALQSGTDALAAYQALQPLCAASSVRVGLIGVPESGLAFPSRERADLDCFLSTPPGLHELAWLVTRSTTGGSPASPHGTQALRARLLSQGSLRSR